MRNMLHLPHQCSVQGVVWPRSTADITPVQLSFQERRNERTMLPPCLGSEPRSPQRLSDLPCCVLKANERLGKLTTTYITQTCILNQIRCYRFVIDFYIQGNFYIYQIQDLDFIKFKFSTKNFQNMFWYMLLCNFKEKIKMSLLLTTTIIIFFFKNNKQLCQQILKQA